MPELDELQPEEAAAPAPVQKEPKAPKGPSKFFSEYYGAAFLFLIAVFVAAAFFVLRPVLDDIKQTNAQTESQIETINRQRSYLASLQQSVAAAQTIPATTLDQVGRALPDDPNLPSLLVQFGSAATRNNVRIDTLNFSQASNVTAAQNAAKPAVAANPQVRPLDISMTLHAFNYFDVKRFLSDLESSLRLMDVLGITANGAGNQVTYTLQMRTYTFVPSGTTP